MNGRDPSSVPTIALVHTQLDGFYQSLLWRGARMAARLHGIRLVTFLGKALGSPIEDESAHNSVFDLVPLVSPDALVVSTTTLGNFCGPETIVQWVRDHLPDLPTVSIGAPLDGSLGLEVPQAGLGRLVDHLILDHGCRTVAFLAGPPGNPEAEARLREYRTSLEQHGLPFHPTLVEPADFMSSRVPAALERLLASHPEIDALVAANDPMAIAAIRELERRGLPVPRRVKVVGYDDIDEAAHQVPSLTTVHAPIFHLGARAVELALGRLGRLEPGPERLETQPVLRDSCGCLSRAEPAPPGSSPLVETLLARLRAPDFEPETFLQGLVETMGGSDDRTHEDWSGIFDSVQERLAATDPQRLRTLRPLLSGGRRLLARMAKGYHARARFDLQGQTKALLRQAQWILLETTPAGIASRLHDALRLWGARARLWVLEYSVAGTSPACLDLAPYEFAWDLGGPEPHPLDPRGRLLPDPEEAGESWVALPLCTGNEQYGLLLVSGELPSESFHEGLRFMATNALRSAHLLERERRLSRELRELSLHDPLTGLYNRRGFLESGRGLERMAREEKLRLGVLFADLDGLKTINDTWGHADGDQAITALGKALAATFGNGACLARLGGDEFAALYLPTEETEAIQRRLDAFLETFSAETGRPWAARASLGWIDWDPRHSPLEDALEQADAQLYLVKRRRKLGRESLRPSPSGPAPD